MCLGVPGRITKISERDGLQMAVVDFGGVSREVCLAYLPEAVVDDYCIVHAGFALTLLSEAEAQETLTLLREIVEPDGDRMAADGSLGTKAGGSAS